MGRTPYMKRYYKENYSRIWIRKEVKDKFKRFCDSHALDYSECLNKLVDEYEKPCVMSKDMEEFIEAAIRLANKYPYDSDSRKLMTLWEKIIG